MVENAKTATTPLPSRAILHTQVALEYTKRVFKAYRTMHACSGIIFTKETNNGFLMPFL